MNMLFSTPTAIAVVLCILAAIIWTFDRFQSKDRDIDNIPLITSRAKQLMARLFLFGALVVFLGQFLIHA